MRQPRDIKINNKTLEQILIDHEHWLKEDCAGWRNMRANLIGANLKNTNLKGVNLKFANLEYANLIDANLEDANLDDTDLRNANLTNANLENSSLGYSDLRGADLRYANLKHADLGYANLSLINLTCANLEDAYLWGANLVKSRIDHTNLEHACLEAVNLEGAYLGRSNLYYTQLEGANLYNVNLKNNEGKLIKYRKGKILTEDIIGYKKCRDNIIVTVLIPRGSIVFSIDGEKCRTNKARVIAIDGADRAYSFYNKMSYYVGDEFTVYNFNCQYNMECGEGIHFFMTREEAERYRE